MSYVPKLHHGHSPPGPCTALKVNPEPSAVTIVILLLDTSPASEMPPPSWLLQLLEP